MDEILTWEEVERRYEGKWVAIIEPEVTAELEIVAGRVIYQGDTYEDAYARANEVPHRVLAVEFVGDAFVEGTPLIL